MREFTKEDLKEYRSKENAYYELAHEKGWDYANELQDEIFDETELFLREVENVTELTDEQLIKLAYAYGVAIR